MSHSPAPYLLDNAAPDAPTRLDALASMHDPHTQRHLLARGITAGWHCLEIGAGNGSIAAWMANVVGPTGRVTATDLDTRHLEAISGRAFDVMQHDITSDPLPDRAYDLIHVRLVLVHLHNRDAVVRKLIAALKPGGWLVDEEYDSDSMPPDPVVSPGESLRPTYHAVATLMKSHGFDRTVGRRQFAAFRAAGLVDVGAEGRVEMLHRAAAGTTLLRANWGQLRDQMVEAGYVAAAEVERDIEALESPEFMMPSSVLWTVWGRRGGG